MKLSTKGQLGAACSSSLVPAWTTFPLFRCAQRCQPPDARNLFYIAMSSQSYMAVSSQTYSCRVCALRSTIGFLGQPTSRALQAFRPTHSMQPAYRHKSATTHKYACASLCATREEHDSHYLLNACPGLIFSGS
jgi:hypothetical protein